MVRVRVGDRTVRIAGFCDRGPLAFEIADWNYYYSHFERELVTA